MLKKLTYKIQYKNYFNQFLQYKICQSYTEESDFKDFNSLILILILIIYLNYNAMGFVIIWINTFLGHVESWNQRFR